jgi:hypothetical protein
LDLPDKDQAVDSQSVVLGLSIRDTAAREAGTAHILLGSSRRKIMKSVDTGFESREQQNPWDYDGHRVHAAVFPDVNGTWGVVVFAFIAGTDRPSINPKIMADRWDTPTKAAFFGISFGQQMVLEGKTFSI